jgi:hypothetical protein
MEEFKSKIRLIGNHLKNNPQVQLPLLLLLVISLAISTVATLQQTFWKSHAYGEAVVVSLNGVATMPPDQSLTLNLDAKTNRVGFARVALTFDRNKIKLAGNILVAGAMGNVVQVTPAADANSSGAIVIAAATTAANRTNAPTGVFGVATLPFTTVSGIPNDTTVINIVSTDTQIVEMHGIVLPINPTAMTLHLNNQTSAPGSGGTITLNPTADNFAAKIDPRVNYGKSAILSVDAGTRAEDSLMKFDLAALSGKTITSAVLKYRISTDSNAGSGGVQNINTVASNSWDENSLNWNNMPVMGPVIASVNGGSAGSWKEVNLTTGIKGHEGQLFSIGMTQTSEDGLDFYSRESADPPKLVINYQESGSGIKALRTSQDAYVSGSTPSDNFGADRKLAVRGSNPMVTYVKFSLSGLTGNTVTSAKLRMHICTSDNTCGTGGSQNIRTVNGDWTEGGINYNNRPSVGGVVGTLAGGGNGTWLETDVTTAVRGKEGNSVSFELDQSSQDGVYFDSRENGTDTAPELVINY